jgi:hypothetical protein
MKEEILKELLEKYYNGDTSVEEEMILKEYFSGEDIFPGYEAEMEVFRHYSTSGYIPVPDVNIEARIKDSIDRIEAHKVVQTPGIRRYAFFSIAAGLLILLASYFMLKQHSGPRDTFSDPRLAYAETMKILNEVSYKLNKGTSALEPVRKITRVAQSGLGSVSKSASVITDNLKSVRMIDKISDANLEIINKK